MSGRAIDVTILICTRNRDRLLGETLDSLAQLHVPAPWRCEVLIVDNGSTDRTRETVLDREAALRSVSRPRRTTRTSSPASPSYSPAAAR